MKNDDEIKRSTSALDPKGELLDTNNQLVKLALEGNQLAYKSLVEKHQKTIYNLLLRMLQNKEEASALTQAVFVKAYFNLKSFRFGFKFFSWIYRIGINEALNHLKNERRYADLALLHEPTVEADDEVYSEKQQLLQRTVDQLPDKFRLLIIMKYYDDMSYKEIALIMKLEEKKVRSRLFEAREILRNKLMQHAYFTK